MSETQRTGMPEGLRDSKSWYLNVDPFSIVDHSLVDFVHQHGGQALLDLGCGLGGYAKLLESRGRNVVALDVNEEYVAAAARLGVNAKLYDGRKIPLPDKSVDTIFMIEVMEHIPQPEQLLAELRRVARRNLIVTVPNCSYAFSAPVVWSHMLDTDHKNFFTMDSLRTLLSSEFRSVEITQVVPSDAAMAKDLLPPWLLRIWTAARRFGYIKDRYYFRLIAEANV